jgi:hypothetical protein
MPNLLFLALLCTFGYFLFGNAYGVYETLAMLADVEQSEHVDPFPYYRAAALGIMRAIVCAAAIGTLLLARKVRTAQLASIAAIAALIVSVLPNAPLVYKVISVLGLSGSAGVMPLVLSVVWLMLLLVAVISNYAFKRTAGTGHRVS